jgi:hypothetical protein
MDKTQSVTLLTITALRLTLVARYSPGFILLKALLIFLGPDQCAVGKPDHMLALCRQIESVIMKQPNRIIIRERAPVVSNLDQISPW